MLDGYTLKRLAQTGRRAPATLLESRRSTRLDSAIDNPLAGWEH